MMDNFSISVCLSEMRLIVEGAVNVYEEHGSPLAITAKKQQEYEAASALESIGTALYSLRDHIHLLQAENTKGRLTHADSM